MRSLYINLAAAVRTVLGSYVSLVSRPNFVVSSRSWSAGPSVMNLVPTSFFRNLRPWRTGITGLPSEIRTARVILAWKVARMLCSPSRSRGRQPPRTNHLSGLHRSANPILFFKICTWTFWHYRAVFREHCHTREDRLEH